MNLAIPYFALNDLFDPSSYIDPAIVSGSSIASVSIAALIIIASVAAALMVKAFISRYMSGLASRTDNSLDDEIVPAFTGPVQALIIVAGIYIALMTLSGLPEIIRGWLGTAFAIVIIIIAAFQISRLVHIVLSWYQKEIEIGRDGISKLDISMLSLLKKALNVIIIIAAALMALAQTGMEITPLIASLGIAGIAAALAAQELLSNVFGAIAILMDKPYKIGDRIELSTGELGDVVDIGMRSTRIRTLDNRIIIIPNSDISKSRIINYSEPDPRLRYKVKIGIAYSSDVDRAMSILLDIAANTDGVLKDPAPYVSIEGFGEYSVNLEMLAWGGDYRKNWNIPEKIYRQALKRFAEEGIEIPYPVRTVIYPGKAQQHQKKLSDATDDDSTLPVY